MSRVSQNESRSGYWICSVNCESTVFLRKQRLWEVFYAEQTTSIGFKTHGGSTSRDSIRNAKRLRVYSAALIWIFFFRASDKLLN